MFQTTPLVKSAIESMYQDTCTIKTQKATVDSDNGIVTTSEVSAGPFPCRLSFSAFPSADADGYAVPALQQSVKLFLAPDVAVTPGADIDVTHLGNVLRFKAASIPASYGSHQEVVLAVREVYSGSN